MLSTVVKFQLIQLTAEKPNTLHKVVLASVKALGAMEDQTRSRNYDLFPPKHQIMDEN